MVRISPETQGCTLRSRLACPVRGGPILISRRPSSLSTLLLAVGWAELMRSPGGKPAARSTSTEAALGRWRNFGKWSPWQESSKLRAYLAWGGLPRSTRPPRRPPQPPWPSRSCPPGPWHSAPSAWSSGSYSSTFDTPTCCATASFCSKSPPTGWWQWWTCCKGPICLAGWCDGNSRCRWVGRRSARRACGIFSARSWGRPSFYTGMCRE
mmetsp:Transcript_39535/g.88769  ORF Transcript_39535/g.88769 Transcript_39535/m.88769 type:complete len:210 (+) Transcript_39535:868-1497(+)